MLPFLKSLLSAPGLSGHEGPLARLIERQWRPLSDELSLSRLGSIHALKRGYGPVPRASILLAAHMDAIGLIVTHVQDGFLRVDAIGGVDALGNLIARKETRAPSNSPVRAYQPAGCVSPAATCTRPPKWCTWTTWNTPSNC